MEGRTRVDANTSSQLPRAGLQLYTLDRVVR